MSVKSVFLVLLSMIFLIPGLALANPLEMSFCKEIPSNINFGDSPLEVTLKMGWESDTDAVNDDGTQILRYYSTVEQGEVQKLPLEIVQMTTGEVSPAIGYFFNDNGLKSLAVEFLRMIDNDDDDPDGEIFKTQVFNPIYAYLYKLYGQPQEIVKSGKRVKVYTWIFKTNRISIFFDKDPHPSGDAWILSIFLAP